MADQNKDAHILDLKAWLETRPQLYKQFVSDKPYGERVLTVFEYNRILGKPDAAAFSLIEAASTAYFAQPIAGLEMMDNYIDGIKGHFMELQAGQERQLTKSEAVNLLRPGQFEDFLLQSDAQFTETVLRLAPMAVHIHPREGFKNDAEFGQAFLKDTEFMIQSLGEGKVMFDGETREPRMAKPIGEILNQEMLGQLRGFIQKKRSRTEEILKQFLSQKN